MSQSPVTHCPVCHAELPGNAVLCIACGYHLKLGHVLATHVEREPAGAVDQNPYATPRTQDPLREHALGESTLLDLTEAGARRAKAVVDDADNVFWMVLLSCVCSPLWVAMLPWYGYRLYSWYRLHEAFAELRQPTAFSPHAQVTARFPDAKPRLMVGVVVGGLLWVWLGVMAVRIFLEN